MSTALVIVGMSVREADARDKLLAIAEEYAGTVAFLQIADPSLSRELTRLADLGVERIDLVGACFGSLAPAQSWLRRIAAHWWRERAGVRPEIHVATKLLRYSGELAFLREDLKPITGNEPGLTSAAWEEVTGHRYQVLICRGPRCTALGSDKSAEALILACMRHELGDNDVLITHTGCQFPCNHAPVVSVQPDDVWYAGVDRDVAERIVTEHLVGGIPVAQHRLRR